MHAVMLPRLEVTTLDGVELDQARPDLMALFRWQVAWLRARCEDLDITVTSVMRPSEPRSVHAYGRGLDYTVEDIEHPKMIAVLLELVHLTNIHFPYRSSNGTPGRTAVYRLTSGRGQDAKHRRHVHLQVSA